MRTVTLKLPDDLATALEAMPEDERNHFATAVPSATIEDDEEEGRRMARETKD